jgi:hypothetical protein
MPTIAWLKNKWPAVQRGVLFTFAFLVVTTCFAALYDHIWHLDPDSFLVSDAFNQAPMHLMTSLTQSPPGNAAIGWRPDQRLNTYDYSNLTKHADEMNKEYRELQNRLQNALAGEQYYKEALKSVSEKSDPATYRKLTESLRKASVQEGISQVMYPFVGRKSFETIQELEAQRLQKVTFQDFIYFSAGIATTVTFGDIIPNNRQVRGIVTFQLFVSVLFISIIGSLFSDPFSNNPSPLPPESSRKENSGRFNQSKMTKRCFKNPS